MARSPKPRCILASHAYAILGKVAILPEDRIAVTIEEDGIQVKIEVGEACPEPPEKMRGLWLSPKEQLICNALARGPLQGKQLAKVLGCAGPDGDLDTKTKYLVYNLCDREIIFRHKGEGYGLENPEVLKG